MRKKIGKSVRKMKNPGSKEALKNVKKSAEKKRRLGLIEESFVSIVFGSYYSHNVGFYTMSVNQRIFYNFLKFAASLRLKSVLNLADGTIKEIDISC